ncbi:MAG: cob(I)yrinic acid a,c-diamide adenosyltransferase [Selenomonadaceae bacterium]|nr:cob(I)yrinic acid a,c-diamide adenosyltransferase [Selenomonadaceae bacterium]
MNKTKDLSRQGLVIVHTGEGKGKTTAALGLALRAWGDGLRVLILQFIKGQKPSGELLAIEKLAETSGEGRLTIRQGGLGFTKGGDKAEAHKEAAAQTLTMAREEISSGAWDLIILDELNYAVKFGLVELKDALNLLAKRPQNLHLVITGRDAPPEIIEAAHLVTEMKLIKHPYQQGIKAQIGIEY